uniref:Integrase zinc-binding domain-containing protein n=1 Tax=Arundo donax TaxID=35708 RepID=A0A0A9AAI4_ARUDO
MRMPEVQRTLHCLRTDFHIPGAKKLVQEFVHACSVCQQHKTEHLHLAGLLQPLPIPTKI